MRKQYPKPGERLREIRRKMEEAYEVMGGARALMARLEKEWAEGNFRVDREAEEALTDIHSAFVEAKEKVHQLAYEYDLIYGELQVLIRGDIKESRMIAEEAGKPQEKSKMN